jgi:hypothetical protein
LRRGGEKTETKTTPFVCELEEGLRGVNAGKKRKMKRGKGKWEKGKTSISEQFYVQDIVHQLQ